jgi:hypothetical protein
LAQNLDRLEPEKLQKQMLNYRPRRRRRRNIGKSRIRWS